ncbi:hypothetical protein JCM12178A_27710 [Salidesulfovibrio brasiliensis]
MHFVSLPHAFLRFGSEAFDRRKKAVVSAPTKSIYKQADGYILRIRNRYNDFPQERKMTW